MDMGRVAILGGTFDPVHWGHLVLAQMALSQLNLERVIWVPSLHPPHKHGSAYEHRRWMVELAIAENSAFTLAQRRMNSTEPDYALSTFKDLQTTDPSCQWFWIIGLDSFQTLPRWYGREQLVPACEWLVAPRFSMLAMANTVSSTRTDTLQEPEHQANHVCEQIAAQLADQNIPIRWQLLQMPNLGISSSLIRQYCHQHRSIRYLVPDSVRAYISHHNLYN
jgi:nicotinate-nucleotide adenylyltransferase